MSVTRATAAADELRPARSGHARMRARCRWPSGNRGQPLLPYQRTGLAVPALFREGPAAELSTATARQPALPYPGSGSRNFTASPPRAPARGRARPGTTRWPWTARSAGMRRGVTRIRVAWLAGAPGMWRSGAACASRVSRPGGETAGGAGRGLRLHRQGRGGEPGSRVAWRRAGVLAARMPVLRDAAAGATQCLGRRVACPGTADQ